MPRSLVPFLAVVSLLVACSGSPSGEARAAEAVRLEFRAEVQVPEGETFHAGERELRLGEARTFDVESAHTTEDPRGAPAIELVLADPQAFRTWTAGLVGKRMAVLLDGEVLLAPTVAEALPGELLLTHPEMGWTPDDAARIASGLAGR